MAVGDLRGLLGIEQNELGYGDFELHGALVGLHVGIYEQAIIRFVWLLRIF